MTVLLTGATGFVGVSVLARLAERGDTEVLALVRGGDGPERLSAALAAAGVDRDRAANVRAVRGDVTAPGLGLAGPPPRLDAIVHCAASVSFGLPLDEARAINGGGTRNVLDVAARTGARLVHVSTAFVAGRHRGLFREGQLATGQAFRNSYEQSKFEAELLVHAAAARQPVVVLRPSIVVGEARTGWTSSFNVLYWPLRAFARGLLPAVPARADGRVDVVPVDYVADAIVHVLAVREDVRGVLHLVAGAGASTVAELLELGSSALGRPAPRLVAPREGLALGERSADASRYMPYFDMDVLFGDSRSQGVLAPAGIVAPPLRDYFPALVEFAQRARWGRSPVSRSEAREAAMAGAA